MKAIKKLESKTCRVCGDKATGYNFKVMTCESCKAFFRRNAVNYKFQQHQCPLQSNCKINVVTRKACRKCRLDKCIAVGMDKECITSEKEKLFKIAKLSLNKIKNNVINEWNLDKSASSSNNPPFQNIQSKSTNPVQSTQDANPKPQIRVNAMPHQAVSIAKIGPNHMQPTSTSPKELMQNVNPKSQVRVNDVPHQPVLIAAIEPSSMQATSASPKELMQNTNPKPQICVGATPYQPVSIAKIGPSQLQPTSTNAKELLQNVRPRPQTNVSTVDHQSVLITATEPSHITSPLIPAVNVDQNTPILHGEELCMDLNRSNSFCSEMSFKANSLNLINLYQFLHNFSKNFPSYLDANNFTSAFKDSKIKLCEDKFGNCCSRNSANSQDIISNWSHSTIEQVLNAILSAEHSDLAKETRLQCFCSNMLSTIETQKVNELINALPAPLRINETKDDRIFVKEDPDRLLMDIINVTDRVIRKMILFTKNISAFKHLCEEDQISIVKGCCTEMLNLYWAVKYNSVKDGWEFPGVAFFKMDQLKEIKGNIYEEYQQFVYSFDWSWIQNDKTLILFITAIVLFTPTRPNILYPDIIKKEMHSYYFLMQRYLESKHSRGHAKFLFMKIIRTIQHLKNLNENHIKVILEANPKYVGPLLNEIFDLCH